MAKCLVPKEQVYRAVEKVLPYLSADAADTAWRQCTATFPEWIAAVCRISVEGEEMGGWIDVERAKALLSCGVEDLGRVIEALSSLAQAESTQPAWKLVRSGVQEWRVSVKGELSRGFIRPEYGELFTVAEVGYENVPVDNLDEGAQVLLERELSRLEVRQALGQR
jgi:hypothetical protein